MRKLILVKHSVPVVTPDTPPNQWRLSETGRKRCVSLARLLAVHDPQRFVSSPEPKALETAEIVANILGKPVEISADLHEHERAQSDYLNSNEQFNAAVARFFAEPNRQVYGKESADEVNHRFAGAIAEVVQLYPEGNIAIVAHGSVISLFVSRAAGIEPFPLWKRLGLPSFVVLALPGPRVVSVVENVPA